MHRDQRFAAITRSLRVVGVLAVLSVGLLAGPAHAGDDRLVRLKLLTESSGRQLIMVDPPHAKIWRNTPNKPKNVSWSTVNYSPYEQLYWEIRYHPSGSGNSANYFGDVDIECGETEIIVQPDIKPDSAHAEWAYKVTVYACVDGARGQYVANDTARIVWKD
jgi:hypothetical protein